MRKGSVTDIYTEWIDGHKIHMIRWESGYAKGYVEDKLVFEGFEQYDGEAFDIIMELAKPWREVAEEDKWVVELEEDKDGR